MAWSERTAPEEAAAAAPHHLLDDGFAPEPCDLLVIGCGNILRGDDAVGPIVVRHLMTRGVPDGVRVVDGGTSGMDVAFAMRGAARVLIIDASNTGVAAGTIRRVPAAALTELPPLDGLHTHNFRWDHALSFGSWLLGPQMPDDITVLLIEAHTCEPGEELTPDVAAALAQVIDLIEAEYPAAVPMAEGATVELTDQGYLHLSAEVSARHFPADVLLARLDRDPAAPTTASGELLLYPVASADFGGLVLKQRNAHGDRSLLLSEVLGFRPVSGRFAARWDDQRGALVVSLAEQSPANPDGSDDGSRRDRAGHRGERPMAGLADRDDCRGGQPPRAEPTSRRTPGSPGGEQFDPHQRSSSEQPSRTPATPGHRDGDRR